MRINACYGERCASKEKSEAIERYFSRFYINCLTGGTKDVETRGRVQEGAVCAVLDERSKRDKANVPQGGEDGGEVKGGWDVGGGRSKRGKNERKGDTHIITKMEMEEPPRLTV